MFWRENGLILRFTLGTRQLPKGRLVQESPSGIMVPVHSLGALLAARLPSHSTPSWLLSYSRTVGWSQPLGVVLNALSRPLVALLAARHSPGHSMPSGLLCALLLLSALLAARRPPDHLTTSLPLNATLATQHPPDCPGPPGRRCAAGDRAGTFCLESQLESPIYFNQSRSQHASLGHVSTT